MSVKSKIEIGQKFGRLEVYYELPIVARKSKHTREFLCNCECGGILRIAIHTLVSGHTKSCGCLRKEKSKSALSTHGMTGTPEYIVWAGMIQRCKDAGADNYKYYGGRGIKVCERWQDFKNFYQDMGKRPDGFSLDRIDVDGDYCPDNCKWSTAKQQGENKRKYGTTLVRETVEKLIELGVIQHSLDDVLEMLKN